MLAHVFEPPGKAAAFPHFLLRFVLSIGVPDEYKAWQQVEKDVRDQEIRAVEIGQGQVQSITYQLVPDMRTLGHKVDKGIHPSLVRIEISQVLHRCLPSIVISQEFWLLFTKATAQQKAPI